VGIQLPQKKAHPPPPNFWPMSINCGQMAGWVKVPLGTAVNVGPGNVVLDEVAAPPKRGTVSPRPSASFRLVCGQTAVWLKTPLGTETEVDLIPGHIALDRVPAFRQRGTAPPLFGPCLLWPPSPISATAELSFRNQFYSPCKNNSGLMSYFLLTILKVTIRSIFIFLSLSQNVDLTYAETVNCEL